MTTRGQGCSVVLLAALTLSSCNEYGTRASEKSADEDPADLEALDALAARTGLPDRALRDRVIYYLMVDRFQNGDPSNDRGSYREVAGVDPSAPAEVDKHGFDPSAAGKYHGGDLAGVTAELDYISALGASAIWTTPIMSNSLAPELGATPTGTGYHGYWVTDFSRVDPHFGDETSLAEYVASAHARGIKVFLDILVNHTAHIKGYSECGGGNCGTYVSKAERPYVDARGQVSDDRAAAFAYSTGAAFPELSLGSFPYTPVVAAGLEHAKRPDWLNDPLLYHNRGDWDATVPESTQYGDLYGLDDLFTLHPTVLSGLIDIYQRWIGVFGIDGYRLDAVRHVEPEFLEQWWPEVSGYARRRGKPDLFAFGEAFDSDPASISLETGGNRLPAVLDFPLQNAARMVFSAGAATERLRRLFEADDFYLSPETSAYYLPTLLSTHDAGRIGAFIVEDNPGASSDEWLARDALAHAFLFTARGLPIIYYGDEQGFTGMAEQSGTVYESARQDMFESRVPEYLDPRINVRLGTSSAPNRDHFDRGHTLYQTLRRLAQLRRDVPELRQGAQVHRYSSNAVGGGLYAFSRIMAPVNEEYLVVFNTHPSQPRSAEIHTLHRGVSFEPVFPPEDTDSQVSDADGYVHVEVPPLSFRVLHATAPLPARAHAPRVSIIRPASGVSGRRFFIEAALDEEDFARVRFFVRPANHRAWTYAGEDDSPPYRVARDVSSLPAGSAIEARAVVIDHEGHRRASPVERIQIENRVKQVRLHYENGNHRSSFFVMRSDGAFELPRPVPAAGPVSTFAWPDGVDSLTFFFETPGRGGAPFSFDEPVTLSLTDDVIPNARLEPDGLYADVYVNDGHEVSGAPSFGRGGGRPRILECDAGLSAPPVPNPPLFIKGELNGWSNHEDPADPLHNVLAWTPGTCELAGARVITAPRGSFRFMFADAAWKAKSTFGGPFTPSEGLSVNTLTTNLRLGALPSDELPRAYRVHFFSFAPLGNTAHRFKFFRFEPAVAPGTPEDGP